MKIKKLINAVLFCSVVSLGTSTTIAAPIVYFGEDLSPGGTVPVGGNAETARNSFLSNLTGVGTENFDSFSNLTSIGGGGIGLSFPGSSGAITGTLTGTNGGICDQTVGGTVNGITCGFSRFATSGNNYLQNASNMTISFSTGISAFGFMGTDFGDFSGVVNVNFSGGGNASYAVNSTQGSQANGNVLFWGLIDDTNSFTSISFNATGGSGDVFGFDDMTVGDIQQISSVPEPGTLSLFLVGVLGLLRGRRQLTSK